MLLLLGKLSTSYSQIINYSMVNIVDGGINVIVNSYGFGTHFISDSYIVNNNQIELTVCFWSDNTTVINTFNNEIFIPLTVSAQYIITTRGFTSVSQSICDYSTPWSENVTTLNFLNTYNLGKVKNNLFIFPNPTNGIIQLSNDQIGLKKIDIFDNLGKLVAHFDNFPNLGLDLQNLNDGIYLIELQTESENFTKKIVLKK